MIDKSRTNRPLSEKIPDLLAIASLFAGNISIDWIQELTGLKASEVLSRFEEAVNKGLLKRGEIGSFSFTDEKTIKKYQACFTSEQKERYHQLIAALLIKDLPDSPQKAELLAPHLLNILNDTRSCHWLMKAAKKYSSDFQTEAALACYVKILDDLAGVHQAGADGLFCDAAIEYAKLNTARNDVKKVISILEEAMLRAKNIKSQRYQSMIDMNFAKNKWLQSQYKSAQSHFENSWKLAMELGDETLIRSIANFKTFLLYWQGHFKDVVLDYEKSLADVAHYPHERFPLLATMTVGTCYGQIGQVTQGIGMIDSIRRHCLETGDIGLAAHSGTCIGAIMLDIGHIDDALQHLVPSVEDVRKMQPDWTTIQGELTLAYAYYLNGDNDQSLRHIGQFYKLSQQVNISVRPWPYLMELCWAIEEGSLPAMPDMSIRQEVDTMMKGENIFLKGVAYRFKALLQKKEGLPYAAIIDSLKHSVEFLETSGHAIELAKTRLELARIYLLQGNQKQALTLVQKACNVLLTLNEHLIPDDLKSLIKPSNADENQLKELIAISRELSLTDNNRDAIGFIISTANRITGAERGGIFLLDNTEPPYSFKLRASKNLTQDQIDLPEFKASLRLMKEAVAAGIGKVQDLRIQENPEAPNDKIILSSICVPIVAGGIIMGVLYHDNRLLSNAFHASLLDLLYSFSSFAALVLEKDKLQKHNEMLAGKIEEIRTHYEKQNADDQSVISEELIGESQELKKVLSQIGEIAKSDTTVLILGETGVGKEVVAKAILNNSLRNDKPFISLNCSALSEKLIYSELFGHEKGSFTGADHRHIGRFEKAHGGTLFLDEIGDLPLDMQVRLLRVLETKEFERVGGKETIRSDFRLITATNRDLEQETKKKLFRADLFYRINVYSIYVPPLRDRRQDIPLLIHYFIKDQTVKTGKISRPITDEEISRLIEYSWPGNVRELKNVVERYVASSQTRITELIENPYHRASPAKNAAVTLADNERRHIEWALAKTMGKIHGPGGAAELLGIHPNTLTFRIKKLGIKKHK
ncbi:MAG: sigma 54-interacting transcriptional regulator [Deltaproteobacteria bacterium]